MKKKTQEETKTETPPAISITLNWSGNMPKAVRKWLEKLAKPRTVTLKIPRA